ncbi:MAG TPA: DUF2857 domain-containing protein [Acidiferrobacteraceae bacterium]|nr:DUF2857 domain-containing protein [Acidiferrobacteraceae bacterium]
MNKIITNVPHEDETHVARQAATQSLAHNSDLIYNVLTAVSKAHAEGKAALVERYGFTRAQAETIARLSAHELHRLSDPKLKLFNMHMDPDALDHMLIHMQKEERHRALQDRLLFLGAPAPLMQELFGWSAQDCADRRKALDIAGADTGRPRRTTEKEDQAIWKSWNGSLGMTKAERYETVASETGLRLNLIWAQVKGWANDGAFRPEDEPPVEDSQNTSTPEWAPPATSKTKISLRRRLWHRFTHRPDSEHDQALIRLATAPILIAYGYFVAPYDQYASLQLANTQHMLLLAGSVFFTVAVLLALSILIWPRTVESRRYISISLDVVGCTIFIGYLGDFGVLFYVMYLWAIVGGGFRYGVNYLIVATVVSMTGFSVVFSIHPYWQSLGAIPYCLLAGLFVVPAWTLVWMRSKTRAQRRAQQARIGAHTVLPYLE